MFQTFFTDNTGTRMELRVLTQDKIEDALAIQQDSMHQECVAIGVGMYEEAGGPEAMKLVFREVLKDGCTLIAINTAENDIVAVAFNKLHVAPVKGKEDPFIAFVEHNLKHKSCLNLIGFLDDIESKVNIFETYNVDAIMEIFYVGTKQKYQGRGIGKSMINGCIEFARGLMDGKLLKIPVSDKLVNEDVIPKVLYGVFASNYSQAIAKKFNFKWVAEITYDSYICENKKMSERIGDVHKSAILGVLKL